MNLTAYYIPLIQYIRDHMRMNMYVCMCMSEWSMHTCKFPFKVWTNFNHFPTNLCQPASLPTAYSYGRGSEPKYSILVMHSCSRFSKFFSGTWTFLRSFLLFMTLKGLRHFEQSISCFILKFSYAPFALRLSPKGM